MLEETSVRGSGWVGCRERRAEAPAGAENRTGWAPAPCGGTEPLHLARGCGGWRGLERGCHTGWTGEGGKSAWALGSEPQISTYLLIH